MAKAKKKKKQSKPNKAKPVKTTNKAKTTKVKAEKKMDRLEASVIVLKRIQDKMAYHTAQQKADELYAQNGGVGNPKEAAYAFKRASKVMVLLKMFEIKDGHLIRLKG